jgi:hypothetical protein
MISPGKVVPQVNIHKCIALQFIVGIGQEMKEEFGYAK